MSRTSTSSAEADRATPALVIIAALGSDGVIGSGAGLPWHVPAEYAQFLARVAGQTVLIGRRSWEIFGGDLTRARCVVVTRGAGTVRGAVTAPSVEQGLRLARSFGRTVYSAGGARIYAATLPLADAMLLSYIKGRHTGDVYFPRFDPDEWIVEERADLPQYELVRYRRRR